MIVTPVLRGEQDWISSDKTTAQNSVPHKDGNDDLIPLVTYYTAGHN